MKRYYFPLKILYEKDFIHFFTLFLLLIVLVSCAQAEGGQSSDYDSTKKMIVDLLKTDEGKLAVKEVLSDEKVKQELIMDQAFVRQAIQDTLVSEQGKKFWQETMKDPEFAQKFAESIQKENEKIIKNLMKDPEYQQMMMDILKDPEMEKSFLELMKTKEYRKQVQTIMAESFESPFFTQKINELLTTIAKKQMEKQEGGGEEEKKSEESGGGGS